MGPPSVASLVGPRLLALRQQFAGVTVFLPPIRPLWSRLGMLTAGTGPGGHCVRSHGIGVPSGLTTFNFNAGYALRNIACFAFPA